MSWDSTGSHSETIKYWVENNIREFYVTVMDRIVKYFSKCLKSKPMEALRATNSKYWMVGKLEWTKKR